MPQLKKKMKLLAVTKISVKTCSWMKMRSLKSRELNRGRENASKLLKITNYLLISLKRSRLISSAV